MKAEICEEKRENVIPEVGEVWHHKNSADIYMRILDEEGSKALSVSGYHDKFFSVTLSHAFCGMIVYTFKTQGNYELLELDGCFRKKSGGD